MSLSVTAPALTPGASEDLRPYLLFAADRVFRVVLEALAYIEDLVRDLLEYLDRRAEEAEVCARPTPLRARRG